MKTIKITTLLLLLIGISSCQLMDEVEKTLPGLALEEGKAYEVSSKAPYNGKMTRYYADGTLKKELHFSDGNQVLAIQYYQNGNKESKAEMTDEGLKMRSWYENGQIKEEFLPGSVRKWHSNGQLKAEVLMNESKDYHGDMRKWCENGTLLAHEVYKEGSLVERVK